MNVRQTLRRAYRAQHAILRAIADEAALERVALHPADAAAPGAGSRPQIVMLDDRGQHYLFKLAPPEQIAAELLAQRLRSAGGRLHVPTARRTLTIDGLGEVTGMIQPKIAIVGELAPDPTTWTPLQREAMLCEHPWEWLLANLDSHVDQYVLVGDPAIPLDIDWDHALVDLDQTELTRFNKRSATVAPIRNLLYADYVLGRVELDFHGMQIAAAHAADVAKLELTGLLDRYADEVGLDPASRRELHERMRRRRRTLVADFARLVDAIVRERADSLGQGVGARSFTERLVARTRDLWQRFVIVVLHPWLLRPTLRAYRVVLHGVARLAQRRRVDPRQRFVATPTPSAGARRCSSTSSADDDPR